MCGASCTLTRWDVNTDQNECSELMGWIKTLTLNDEVFMVRRTMLLDHCHIVAQTTVDVETDSSHFSFTRKFHISVRSVELEACQLQSSFIIPPPPSSAVTNVEILIKTSNIMMTSLGNDRRSMFKNKKVRGHNMRSPKAHESWGTVFRTKGWRGARGPVEELSLSALGSTKCPPLWRHPLVCEESC